MDHSHSQQDIIYLLCTTKDWQWNIMKYQFSEFWMMVKMNKWIFGYPTFIFFHSPRYFADMGDWTVKSSRQLVQHGSVYLFTLVHCTLLPKRLLRVVLGYAAVMRVVPMVPWRSMLTSTCFNMFQLWHAQRRHPPGCLVVNPAPLRGVSSMIPKDWGRCAWPSFFCTPPKMGGRNFLNLVRSLNVGPDVSCEVRL